MVTREQWIYYLNNIGINPNWTVSSYFQRKLIDVVLMSNIVIIKGIIKEGIYDIDSYSGTDIKRSTLSDDDIFGAIDIPSVSYINPSGDFRNRIVYESYQLICEMEYYDWIESTRNNKISEVLSTK